jgi:Flp pilus assembly protein TadG
MKMFTRKMGRGRQKGNAMVEFALGSGILMAVFAGVFEFGYAFYVYNNLQTAVNNGAKYPSLRTYESTTNTPSACFKSAVQDMVAYGDPTGTSTTPVAPGLTPSDIAVNVTFSNGVPSQMTVSLSSYNLNAVFTTINLTNKPQMTYPFLGQYAPGSTCSQ